MRIRISGGARDQGVVVGNAYDKYGSANPIVRIMMRNFESALSDLVSISSPKSIHEVGCGEGYWVLRWNLQGIPARGCDFSQHVINLARDNAIEHCLSPSIFVKRNIYDLEHDSDSADLVVCCEVLEHLEDANAGLRALQRATVRHLIISVPREPIWRSMNIARGKYLKDWGNTPGHIQHWSQSGFIRLVSRYFHITETRSPLPWSMLLCNPRE